MKTKKELTRKTPLRSKAPKKPKTKPYDKSKRKKAKKTESAWKYESAFPVSTTPRKKSTYTRAVREQVRERDGGLCQMCGGPGTQIHHCVTRRRFEARLCTFNDVHDPVNLMLICNDCHLRIHNDELFLQSALEYQESRFGKLIRRF